MLRELSHLLDELHDGLLAVETRSGVQLSNVEMTLPLQLRPVLRGGGGVLLADLPRSREVNAWLASPSKLRVSWSADDSSARHPREGGDPATLLSLQHERVEKALGSRFRGNDEPGKNEQGGGQP